MVFSAHKVSLDKNRENAKAQRFAALRQAMGRIHPISGWAGPDTVPALIRGLPGPGFPCGVLNEVIGSYKYRAAAFGFVTALMAVALQEREGAAMFVVARRALDCGFPYGHGLRQLGVDPSRLILVEAKTDKDALWAIEEALRSGTRPALVAGATEHGLNLTQSRRLNLAAAAHATPLVLSAGAKAEVTSAAATRWRITSAPATLDRFGMFARWRWHAALERCRNGRTGAWLIEWDPAALRFHTREKPLLEACGEPRLAAVASLRPPLRFPAARVKL